MQYQTLFFDLDDTLYPHTAGLWEAIRQRMDLYMSERLGLAESEIPRLRMYYLETYGTTLRGLQNHLHVDAQDFLAFVHDLPVRQYLKPDPSLRSMLLSLPQRRWIFTNADHRHANRVLDALELRDCFQDIIDVNKLQFIPKPDIAAFQLCLEIAGAQPAASVFFDDAARNLLPAKQLGLKTILVGPITDLSQDEFDIQIDALTELPIALPELWNSHYPPPIYEG
jgi:putative hydrolase of the HAD superfamily